MSGDVQPRDDIHELNNLLATIVALVSMRRRIASKDDQTSAVTALDDVMERIHALSRIRTVSGRGDRGPGFALGELAIAILDAGDTPRSEKGSRIEIAGPDVRLPRRLLLPLGLVLSELYERSRRIGALATADGRLSLTWTTGGQGTGATVDIKWRETRLPVVDSMDVSREMRYSDKILKSVATQVAAEIRTAITSEGMEIDLGLPAHIE